MSIIHRQQHSRTRTGNCNRDMGPRISKQHPLITMDGRIKRRYAGNTERGRTLQVQPERNLAMAGVAIVSCRQQHSSGSRTGNQHGVANGLDRGCVDIVVDDRATRMQTDNHNDHGNRKTAIIHSIGSRSGTRTSNHNHKMGHGLGTSARDKTMPNAKDNTINNKCCCCRQQHT